MLAFDPSLKHVNPCVVSVSCVATCNYGQNVVSSQKLRAVHTNVLPLLQLITTNYCVHTHAILALSLYHVYTADIGSYILVCVCSTVFGGEKRSHAMPIQISSLVAAHNSLWVGTENGILLTFPFNAPSVVAEETGWEVIKVRPANVRECSAFTDYIYCTRMSLHSVRSWNLYIHVVGFSEEYGSTAVS